MKRQTEREQLNRLTGTLRVRFGSGAEAVDCPNNHNLGRAYGLARRDLSALPRWYFWRMPSAQVL